MHERTSFYLETNGILYKNSLDLEQKRRKNSTIDAITKFVTDTTTCLDEKELVMAVFLDLSNAFDTIGILWV